MDEKPKAKKTKGAKKGKKGAVSEEAVQSDEAGALTLNARSSLRC